MISAAMYDDAFTLAEDILRLDPWRRLPTDQLLLLEPAENPHAFVAVAFAADSGRRDLSFLLGDGGIRAHLDLKHKSGAEGRVAEFEQHRLLVSSGDIDLSDDERDLRSDEPAIALRRQSPGSPAAPIREATDLTYLIRFLRALRHILCHETDIPRTRLDSLRRLTVPAWRLVNDKPQRVENRRLDPFTPAPRRRNHIDEFTNYRISRLPIDADERELFLYYLPLSDTISPRAFFLVNLESGMIEWNCVWPGDNWMQPVLRRLYKHFERSGTVPDAILTANISVYNALFQDLNDAGIYFEPIPESFVADELVNTYIPHLDRW